MVTGDKEAGKKKKENMAGAEIRKKSEKKEEKREKKKKEERRRGGKREGRIPEKGKRKGGNDSDNWAFLFSAAASSLLIDRFAFSVNKSVTFLGSKISREGIRPEEDGKRRDPSLFFLVLILAFSFLF